MRLPVPMSRLSVTLLLSAWLLACSEPNERPIPPVAVAVPTSEAPSAPPVAAPANPEPPMPTTPSPATADALNQLGFDLWRRIDDRGNLVVGPASLLAALDMTFMGARAATADQMANVLHATGDRDAFHAEVAALLRQWEADGRREGLTLSIANRLFGERTYAFDAAFVEKTRQLFGAPLEALDFRAGAEPARQHINAWVAERTQSRIRDLIPPQGVTDETRLVLVNAMYLLARWSEPFMTAQTSPATFHVHGTRDVTTPTMHQTSFHRYGEAPGVQLLELGYDVPGFAMLFVLPRERDGLAAMERTLTAEVLRTWDQALSSRRVEVALPTFRVAPAVSLELSEALKALGMPLAFDRDQADFTGIANPPSPADRLLISFVFHKAFLEVNEVGTEAAAATAVSMMRAGSAPRMDPPVPFHADHRSYSSCATRARARCSSRGA